MKKKNDARIMFRIDLCLFQWVSRYFEIKVSEENKNEISSSRLFVNQALSHVIQFWRIDD